MEYVLYSAAQHSTAHPSDHPSISMGARPAGRRVAHSLSPWMKQYIFGWGEEDQL